MTELETIREQRDKAVDALRRYHDEAESEHYKGDGCWCDDLLRDMEDQIAGESEPKFHYTKEEIAVIEREVNEALDESRPWGLIGESKPLIRDASRDFPEDSDQENGNYENWCSICGAKFIGNKHRVICKKCTRTTEEV